MERMRWIQKRAVSSFRRQQSQRRTWQERSKGVAELWAAEQIVEDFETIGLGAPGETADHDVLQRRLGELTASSPEPLWLVFIGHGTFDGKVARFNLRGPDVSLPELSDWLKPVERPLAIINCASCSGPFLMGLSGPNRIVVTSTRSGHELNFSRFGDYLSTAIADPQADLDKDDQTSLLEAFLMASRHVKEFYDVEGRLATEHALVDDTGDGMGTPPDWFRGVRASKSAKDGATLDGFRAHQFHLVKSDAEQKLSPAVRTQRNELERAIAILRDTKAKLPEDEYYQKLEALLIDLSRLYESAEKKP